MIEINEATEFQETVRNASGLVLVDFFTTWCGPCRMLAPVLAELENVTVVKVDGDKHQDLIVEHGVAAYPTMVFYKDGVVVGKEVGLLSKENLQKTVDDLNGG